MKSQKERKTEVGEKLAEVGKKEGKDKKRRWLVAGVECDNTMQWVSFITKLPINS